MQTIPVGYKFSSLAISPTSAPLAQRIPGALLPSSVLSSGDQHQATFATSGTHEAVYAELDTMLIQTPAMGAFNGMRVAMLFNGGIVLCAFAAWEIWTLLA